jgi:hypothetical protein
MKEVTREVAPVSFLGRDEPSPIFSYQDTHKNPKSYSSAKKSTFERSMSRNQLQFLTKSERQNFVEPSHLGGVKGYGLASHMKDVRNILINEKNDIPMPNFHKKTQNHYLKFMRGRNDVSVEGKKTVVSTMSMSVSRAELVRFQP